MCYVGRLKGSMYLVNAYHTYHIRLLATDGPPSSDGSKFLDQWDSQNIRHIGGCKILTLELMEIAGFRNLTKQYK